MYTGLYAAVSGSLAHEKRLAILTNNLANTNTVGFKADQPVFQVGPLPHVVRPLVEPGRNNPSLYAINGRPVYVHLNGLAIVRLK